MQRYRGVGRGAPLLVGFSIAAVALGATISLLPSGAVVRVLAASLGTILIVGLAAAATPAVRAKGRTLAAGFQWWHGLWILVFASGFSFRARSIETIQDTPVDFWAGWRIVLMALVAMVLLRRLAGRTTDWSAALLRGLPTGILLCGLTSLISTLWSVYPMWTLYKSVEYLVDVALLAAIVSAVRNIEEIKSLFDLTWLLTGLLLVTVWLGVVLRPDESVVTGIGAIGIEIQGVVPAISNNGVGDLAATLLVIAAARLVVRQHGRSFYWLVCLVAFVTLILAQSRSPFTGALLGLVAVFFLTRRFGLLAVVGLAGIAVTALTNAETVVQQAFLRGQSPDLFYSLSGRVGYWIPAWELFRGNPLLGLGGYAAGRFAVLGSLGAASTETSSLHNGWIEILVGVGLVGFVPFLVTFLGMWLNLLRAPDTEFRTPLMRELRIETIGLFVLLCFRSIFTAQFIWHPPIPFFLLLAFAELLRRARHEGLAEAPEIPVLAMTRLSVANFREHS
jgi:O-antigen ligase